MTTIASRRTGPAGPAGPGVLDVSGAERRQQHGPVSDAGPGGIEVLGAPVLRWPLDRDTAQSQAAA